MTMTLNLIVYKDALQCCLWQNDFIVAQKSLCLYLYLLSFYRGAEGVLRYLLGAVLCGSWHSRLHLS